MKEPSPDLSFLGCAYKRRPPLPGRVPGIVEDILDDIAGVLILMDEAMYEDIQRTLYLRQDSSNGRR